MKYAQRRPETAMVKKMLPGRTIQFPGPDPFEGEGECVWFHQGRLLVVGYGFRCTRRSVRVLDELLRGIYTAHGVTPPKVVALKLTSPFFYHLLEEHTTKTCLGLNANNPASIWASRSFNRAAYASIPCRHFKFSPFFSK